jgi:hypothetical protein
MANVTITLDDMVLANARRTADRAGKSLSRYIADIVEATMAAKAAERVASLDVFLTENMNLLNDDGTMPTREDMNVRPGLRGCEHLGVRGGRSGAGQAGRGAGVAEAPGHFEHDDREPAGRDGTS